MNNNCNKCGKVSQSCGCSDGPYTTVPGCPCPPDANCMVPNKCPELTDAACVYYNDAGIVDIGIEEGTSFQEIIQKLTIWVTNPTCATPGNPCQSTFNVYLYLIGSSSIAIAWIPSVTAVSYQVEYKNATDVAWTLLPIQLANTPLTAVISPLFPNTTYLVRVNTFCNSGNCYSVTLKINTKP